MNSKELNKQLSDKFKKNNLIIKANDKPLYYKWQELPSDWDWCTKKKKFYLKVFKQELCKNIKCSSQYCKLNKLVKTSKSDADKLNKSNLKTKVIEKPLYFKWQELPSSWDCCIKKEKYFIYYRQIPCNNSRCPSQFCHRGRSMKNYKHLAINYHLNPPTYAIGFNFSSDSDVLNQEEAIYLRSELAKGLRKSKDVGWDILNEWDKKEQIHFHGSTTVPENHPYFNDKIKMEEFLANLFIEAVNKTNDKFYTNIIPADNIAYCEPIRDLNGLSKYYAKAEHNAIKHNPRPLSWQKRMRNSLHSTGYYKVHKDKIDEYLKSWHELYKDYIKKVSAEDRNDINAGNLETLNNENKDIRLFNTNLSFAELIFNSLWGCALIVSLMFLINKVDALSVKPSNRNDLVSDQNDRTIFMRNWFLKYGSVYYQIE